MVKENKSAVPYPLVDHKPAHPDRKNTPHPEGFLLVDLFLKKGISDVHHKTLLRLSPGKNRHQKCDSPI